MTVQIKCLNDYKMVACKSLQMDPYVQNRIGATPHRGIVESHKLQYVFVRFQE